MVSSDMSRFQKQARITGKEMSRHFRTGSYLLREWDERRSYWLNTDVILDGQQEFEERCERYNQEANKRFLPSLSSLRLILSEQ